MQQLTEKIGGNNALGNLTACGQRSEADRRGRCQRGPQRGASGDMGMSDLEKKYAGAGGGSSSAQAELEAMKARMGAGGAPCRPGRKQ